MGVEYSYRAKTEQQTKEVGLKIKPKFIYNYDTELVGVEYSYRAKTEQQTKAVYQIEKMFDKFVAFDLI